MSDESNTGRGGQEWRPSKALWAWSVLGAVVLTLIVGFTWGGWVTGGTYAEAVADAEREARVEMATAVCVGRILETTDVRERIAALEEARSWERGRLIEEGGWVTFAGIEEPVSQAARRCAERVLEADLPVVEETTVIQH